jgi:hypothetical protein
MSNEEKSIRHMVRTYSYLYEFIDIPLFSMFYPFLLLRVCIIMYVVIQVNFHFEISFFSIRWLYIWFFFLLAQVFASRYLSELSRVKTMINRCQSITIPHLQNANIAHCYRKSSSRLFVLDYDETLFTIKKRPELNIPTKPTIELLEALTRDPSNCVYLLSDLSLQTVESWFNAFPGLGLM